MLLLWDNELILLMLFLYFLSSVDLSFFLVSHPSLVVFVYFLSRDIFQFPIRGFFCLQNVKKQVLLIVYVFVRIVLPSLIPSHRPLYMKVDFIFLDHSGYVPFPMRTSPPIDPKDCIYNMEPTTYIMIWKNMGYRFKFLLFYRLQNDYVTFFYIELGELTTGDRLVLV